MTEKTGTLEFTVDNETFHTWYKIIGDLASNKRPLVVLHGGPGIIHNYLIPFADLSTAHGIPIVFYDQLGNGQSTHLPNKPRTFWTVGLFMDELQNLLTKLNIADNFDLVGHSWGGMLASQFAIDHQPPGLRKLILSNSLASMPLWTTSVRGLLQEFPNVMRETIEKHEKNGTTDDKEYQEAMMQFYAKHVCKVNPWPEDLQVTFGALEAEPTVYHCMQGPSEFTITGSLKDWSVLKKLHQIRASTLVINSVFDEAQDICVEPFVRKIPNAKWEKFVNSSHMPFWEERESYMKVVGKFLLD